MYRPWYLGKSVPSLVFPTILVFMYYVPERKKEVSIHIIEMPYNYYTRGPGLGQCSPASPQILIVLRSAVVRQGYHPVKETEEEQMDNKIGNTCLALRGKRERRNEGERRGKEE